MRWSIAAFLRMACVVALIAIVGSVCVAQKMRMKGAVRLFGAGGNAAGAAKEDKNEEPIKPTDVEVADDIEKNVTLAREDSTLAYRLARIERDLDLAHRAAARSNAEEAKSLFDSSYGGILSVRSEFVDKGAEPLVRDYNLLRTRYGTQPPGDTWRPLSEHLTRLFAHFPRHYHQDFDDRFGAQARSEFDRARDSGDELAVRDVCRRYFLTSAGRDALDTLVTRAFERADFLDALAWLMLLKETSPWEFQQNPMRGARYMLSLRLLGEEDMLADETLWAGETFKHAFLKVGDDRLDFAAALDRLAAGFGVAAAPAPQRAGKLGALPLIRPLGSTAEMRSLADVSSTPSIMPDAVFFGGGAVVPRDDESLFWFPSLDAPLFRWLQLSPDHRHEFKKPENNEEEGRWRYYGNSDPAKPATRLRTAAVYRQQLPLKSGDRAAVPQSRDLLVSTFGFGTAKRGQNTGNQIQIFSLTRGGEAVATLPRDDEAEVNKTLGPELHRTHFGGQAVVRDDRLYIMGCHVLANSSEVHLHCFDVSATAARFGALLWREKVSAIQGIMEAWQADVSEVVESSTLTVSGSRLLAATNCGTIACLDARDGHLWWAVEYRRRVQNTGYNRWWGRWNGQRYITSEPPYPSPVTLYGVTAVAAPSDGTVGLCVNAWDGKVLKPLLDTTDRQYDSLRFFTGVSGGYAYFQVSGGMRADPVTYSGLVKAQDGKRDYGKPLKSDGVPPELKTKLGGNGRAIIVGEDVLLPAKTGLFRFDLYTLKFRDFQRWPDLPPEKPEPVPGEGGKDSASNPDKEKEKEPELIVPGCVSLHYLPKGSGPGGCAALLRLDLHRFKIYPLNE